MTKAKAKLNHEVKADLRKSLQKRADELRIAIINADRQAKQLEATRHTFSGALQECERFLKELG